MGPEHWIALASIGLTAANLIYNARRDRERMSHESDLKEAEFREARAALVRDSAFERLVVLRYSVDQVADFGFWLFHNETKALMDETLRSLDHVRAARMEASWFQYLGWTAGIREAGDSIADGLDDVHNVLTDTRSWILRADDEDTADRVPKLLAYLQKRGTVLLQALAGTEEAISVLDTELRES